MPRSLIGRRFKVSRVLNLNTSCMLSVSQYGRIYNHRYLCTGWMDPRANVEVTVKSKSHRHSWTPTACAIAKFL